MEFRHKGTKTRRFCRGEKRERSWRRVDFCGEQPRMHEGFCRGEKRERRLRGDDFCGEVLLRVIATKALRRKETRRFCRGEKSKGGSAEFIFVGSSHECTNVRMMF